MKKLISALKYILFLGIGVWIFYYLYTSQEANFIARCAQNGIEAIDCNFLDKIKTDFKNANFFYIFLILVAFFISNVSRAYRWRMLLEPLGYTMKLYNGFLAIMLGYLANLGFPRMGEFVRAATLAKYEDKDVTKVMGTIVTDRIFDVLSLLTVIGLAFIFNFEILWDTVQPGLAKLSFLSSPLFWGGAVVLAGVGLFILKKMMGSDIPIIAKIKGIITNLIEGILSIRKLKNIPGFIFHSIVIWLMYFLMTYLGFKAVGFTEHLGLNAALVTFVFGSLGMVIPTPGGIGSYHALMMQALSFFGIQGDDGFSFANILFLSIQIFANLFFGVMALILMPILNKKKPNGADQK